MNTKIDRDEIRSQLKEGLIHSRKILKNKKGKKNEDLIFTLGTKQFLINRCDVGSAWGDEKEYKSPSCFFMQDSERRERKQSRNILMMKSVATEMEVKTYLYISLVT